MTNNEGLSRGFSFQRRPLPIPGDLRIAWRVALVVLMLGYSRSNRASLAKLHILNDAIRSGTSNQLALVVNGARATLPWALKVEPAFARALDFVVGEKLAAWTRTSGRSALQLTAAGVKAFSALSQMQDVLAPEREVIATYAKKIPEAMVYRLLAVGRGAT